MSTLWNFYCFSCKRLCTEPFGTLVTGRNEVVAKVMFLHLCAILFIGGGVSRQGEPPRQEGGTPPDQADPPGRENPPAGRTPPPGSRLQNTVYERPVRILLECILVMIWHNKAKTLSDAVFTASGSHTSSIIIWL